MLGPNHHAKINKKLVNNLKMHLFKRESLGQWEKLRLLKVVLVRFNGGYLNLNRVISF